jgi:hypothetical protein
MSRTPLYALTLALAACGADPDDDGQPEYDFTLTQPLATVELLPGGEVPITWSMAGAAEAHLVIELSSVSDDLAYTIVDETITEGPGGGPWAGRDVEGQLVLPDVFDIVASVYVDGLLVGGALRNLSVHGAYVTYPPPDYDLEIAASDGEVDLTYMTVSQRVIRIVTSLDPDPAVDGDELVIDERTIPGEFVPFERIVHFTGVTLADAAIPEGDYTVTLDVSDDDDPTLAYRRTGGRVLWRPGA